MRLSKTNLLMIPAFVCLAILTSCGSGRYKVQPFGGMNGRVQKVTTKHLMAEVWAANNPRTPVMKMISSVYDTEGNEICSALMDSAGRILSEAESLFENGVCIRSAMRAGGRTIAHLSLVSENRGVLEYNKEIDGRIVRMTVRESGLGRRHKSVVTEDGKVTKESITLTDRKGHPIEVTTIEPLTGKKTVEKNILDKDFNVIEKHVTTLIDGKTEERITYIEYFAPDKNGNWTEARTYNDFRMPDEIILREFEYW